MLLQILKKSAEIWKICFYGVFIMNVGIIQVSILNPYPYLIIQEILKDILISIFQQH